MTLQEALRTGKVFRSLRKNGDVSQWLKPNCDAYQFFVCDILNDTWEVEEPKVTITKKLSL